MAYKGAVATKTLMYNYFVKVCITIVFCVIYIVNINFACYFVWVWNLVADIAGGKEAEGVWEHGVEENIWTEEERVNGRMEETA